MERTHGKAAAGGPSEVGLWSRVDKAAAGSEAAAGGPGDRPCNPEFQQGEIKPQTTD